MPFRTTEIIGLLGMVFSVAAVWLQWNLPCQLSRLEDRMKDGRLKPVIFTVKMRRARIMPMVCTLIGAGLLFGVVLRLGGE